MRPLVLFVWFLATLPGGAAAASLSEPLRCTEEGLCLTEQGPGLLTGACRVDDQEVRFDVFAHTGASRYDVSSLQWSDWCGRIVDQDGSTVTAVYGHERCLNRWIPDWRHRLENGVLRGMAESTRFSDPILLDCLGKMMDDSSLQHQAGEWMILRALAHACVLACMQGD